MLSIERYHKLPKGVYLDPFLKENNGGYFQSEDYFSICYSIPDNKPHLILIKEDGNIVGSLLSNYMVSGKGLKRVFSRRVIVIGGPIISTKSLNRLEIANKLIQELVLCQAINSIYIEFRNLYCLEEIKPVFNSSGFKYLEYFNFQTDLTNKSEVNRKISKSKLRQIKKSLKTGATIEQIENEEELNQLYQIINELYKNKAKKPLPNYQFFQQLFQRSIFSNSIKIFIVKYNGVVIGGIIAPVFNGTIYEWYICGKDGAYNNIYPSVLATWAPIQYGIENGLKTFDFLGAGSPKKGYGVREFKARFGGELKQYGRYIRINKKTLYIIGLLGYRVLSIAKKI